MKYALRFACLVASAWGQSTNQTKARNIAIVKYGAEAGTFIATSSDMGPLVLKVQGLPEITIGVPSGIVSMDDVSISDEGYLFGLSVYTPVLCSFNVALATIDPLGCIDAAGFSLEVYTGLSCNKGTCVVSGGTGGYTVIYYDVDTGVLDSTLKCLNCRADVDNDKASPFNYVEVAMVSSRYAAFSVVGASGYNSVVVDLITNIAAVTHAIPDPVNDTLAVAPTNFPCVSDVVRSTGLVEYLFTACGSLTVQLVLTANTTTVISPPVENFTSIALSVDSELNVLVVAGTGSEGGVVALYTIDPNDPSNTQILSSTDVELTVLSVAIHDGNLGFVALESPEIIFNNFGFSQEPSSVPLGGPSVSPESNLNPSSASSSSPAPAMTAFTPFPTMPSITLSPDSSNSTSSAPAPPTLGVFTPFPTMPVMPFTPSITLAPNSSTSNSSAPSPAQPSFPTPFPTFQQISLPPIRPPVSSIGAMDVVHAFVTMTFVALLLQW